ncbi:MAG: archease [Candidatus Woesearchaeota archaeon]|nr:archease [Candidatus Woesearchaeota archaeon]
MPFHLKENMITADLAFEANATTISGLFKSCAQAVAESSASPKTIAARIKKKILLKNTDIEKLLFDFLDELIYVKDTKGMVYRKIDVSVTQNKKTKVWKATSTVFGDTIDRSGKKKQDLLHDLKAVTLHRFSVTKEKGIWKAFVVIDL